MADKITDDPSGFESRVDNAYAAIDAVPDGLIVPFLAQVIHKRSKGNYPLMLSQLTRHLDANKDNMDG